MDDWKKVVQWAAHQQQEERHRAREHLKHTIRAWPMIIVATIPFGVLAFLTLDTTLASVCTALVLITSVLVAEHLAQ